MIRQFLASGRVYDEKGVETGSVPMEIGSISFHHGVGCKGSSQYGTGGGTPQGSGKPWRGKNAGKGKTGKEYSGKSGKGRMADLNSTLVERKRTGQT